LRKITESLALKVQGFDLRVSKNKKEERVGFCSIFSSNILKLVLFTISKFLTLEMTWGETATKPV
jgi:hypothetical protein